MFIVSLSIKAIITLIGRNVFEVSAAPTSCTEEPSMQRGFWDGNGPEFELIDTPGGWKVTFSFTNYNESFLGLNDSEGRDTEHIANIIETLKAGRFINTFLIVRNGNEQRMTKAYTDMLRIFELGFGVRQILHMYM